MTDRKCNADLESLLRTNFGNSVKVVDHEFDSLVPLGENFGSDLRKLWIRIKKSEDSPTEDFHFVWKTISKAEFSVDWNWLLKREVFMYTDIVPLYSRLERGNEIPETIEKMVPKLYGHRSDESDPVILLENVRPSGYRTIGKNKGLNAKQATLAARALARFHALGIVAKTQSPEDFERIRAVAEKPGFDSHGEDALRRNIASIIRNDSRFTGYSERIEKLADKYERSRNYEMVSSSDAWSTICHNDFWTNNVMFKDGEEEEEVKFIDFQTYCFANATLDLTYFLCISLDDIEIFNDVLDAYHETLVATLRSMRIRVDEKYSREELDERLRKDAPYEFFHCAIALVYFTSECVGQDYESLMRSIMSCSVGDLFYVRLGELLKIYEANEWLE